MLLTNDFLESSAERTRPEFQEFCEVCKAERLKRFLQSFGAQGKRVAAIGPKQFLLLREFFLESYDKRLFVNCKDAWNEVRTFDVLRFLDCRERFSANLKLEQEIKSHLRRHFDVEGKKPFCKAVSTLLGKNTLALKKSLLLGLEQQKLVLKFEDFAQKVFLREFGVVLELRDDS